MKQRDEFVLQMLHGKSGFISSPLQIVIISWSLFLTLFLRVQCSTDSFDPTRSRGSLPRGDDAEAIQICNPR